MVIPNVGSIAKTLLVKCRWHLISYISITGRLEVHTSLFRRKAYVDQHVLSSISIHISLVIPLPSKTCLLIERLMKNFLWSSDPEHLSSDYVRWNTVCLPKQEGGLGLRRLKDLNDACFLKMAWSVVTGSSLWGSWCKARYCKVSFLWHPQNPRIGSTIWKKDQITILLSVVPVFLGCRKW